MSGYEHKYADDFLKAIELNLSGYRHSSFSYLAIRNGDSFELRQGRLSLGGFPQKTPFGHFESKNIKAGIFKLEELKLTERSFIETLFSGRLQTPKGDFLFPPEKEKSYSVYYARFHPNGMINQCRQRQLIISGSRSSNIQTIELDWELKAAPIPFFDLQELCNEYFVGQFKLDSLSVEVVAYNVAVISAESSIDKTKAKLAIDLVEGLQSEKASIGYRVFEMNKVAKRGLLSGSALTWNNIDGVQRGEAQLEVSIGAVFECVANYNEEAQSYRPVFDPKTAQNPLFLVHQTFDKNLEILQASLAQAQGRGANARDVEVAIAWLLWMLGFSVSYISGISKTTDAPDLIAATTQGNILVVECTMGILKEDNKLPHLVSRAEKIRNSLEISGYQSLRVLPIIVTTKPREEIKADLEQAYKLGVFVVTRETLAELLEQTKLIPDASRLYAQAEEKLKSFQNPAQFQSIF
jgi:Holliday junction resolvase